MNAGKTLLSRYVTYIASLVSVALLVSGIVSLYYGYSESKANRLALQREKAKGAALHIRAYLDGIERQIAWVRPLGWGPEALDAMRSDYLRLINDQPAIVDVKLLDGQGRERLSVSSTEADVLDSMADASFIPEYAAASALPDKFHVGAVDFHVGSVPSVKLSIKRSSPITHTAVVTINLKHVQETIAQIVTQDSDRKTVAYIVDNFGMLIAHPRMDWVLQRTDLSDLAHVGSSRSGADRQDIEVLESRSRETGDVLVASAPIPSTKWRVFFEEPLSQAYAPLLSAVWRVLAILMLGLSFAIVVSMLLARHMVTPIREIQRGASRIAAGSLGQPIDVNSGDELEALANEFNSMAQKLQQSRSSLERTVKERTRELTELLAQQVSTSEVLKSISRSSIGLDSKLDELIASVVRLGRATAAGVYRREASGSFELCAAHSGDDALSAFAEQQARAIAADESTISGRAILQRRSVQVEDVAVESAYRFANSGLRTVLAVPIMWDEHVIGVIVAVRTSPARFDDKQIAVIANLADQAGIAMENARLFEELAEKSRELEKASRHKSEFLANVSHELRTPLNAIIGFSEVLLERLFGDINPKQAEYLNDILESGEHLLALINDVLHLSRIEAGQMVLELASLDVREVIRGAVNIVSQRARSGGVEIEIDVTPSIAGIVADERKLTQILINLLSNAIKFTPAGGWVRVEVRRGDGAMEFVVADSGVGIPGEYLSRIFDPFVQVPSVDVKEGTGLGLSVTRELVELHGGSIDVESEEGKGSRFRFAVPLRLKASA